MSQIKYKDGKTINFESYQEHSEKLDSIAENILALICNKNLTFGDVYQVLEKVKTKLHGLKVTP